MSNISTQEQKRYFTNPWNELGKAVIRQACEDYIRCLRFMKKADDEDRPVQHLVMKEMEACERFFESDFFHTCAGLDFDLPGKDLEKLLWSKVFPAAA